MLRLDGIVKGFGGEPVLKGVSLVAESGRVTGVIGPNGAGKSTLFSTITGFLPPDRGTVHLDGVAVQRMRPDEIARRGLVRTFQVPREFGEMSVLDNLRVAGSGPAIDGIGASLFLRRRVRAAECEIDRRVDAMLARLRLDHVAGNRARALSGGQKKLLELGRALMTGPRVLLVDEPFAGVAPALRDQLLGHFTDLRNEGLCLVIIEHDMEAIMAISDQVCVLVAGTVLLAGPPAQVQRDSRVLDAYLGSLPA